MRRRSFLAGMAGILAASMAPAAVRGGILMPTRQVWTPEPWQPAIGDRISIEGAGEFVLTEVSGGITYYDVVVLQNPSSEQMRSLRDYFSEKYLTVQQDRVSGLLEPTPWRLR